MVPKAKRVLISVYQMDNVQTLILHECLESESFAIKESFCEANLAMTPKSNRGWYLGELVRSSCLFVCLFVEELMYFLQREIEQRGPLSTGLFHRCCTVRAELARNQELPRILQVGPKQSVVFHCFSQVL